MREARAEVLRRSHVVATTLSTSGGSDNTQALGRAVTSRMAAAATSSAQLAAAASLRWDAVVIDEACQATEASVLVAVAAATTRRDDGRSAGPPPTVVLVGDPCQLPATLLSKRSSAAGYGRSTFERILASTAGDGSTLAEAVSPRDPSLAPPSSSWRPTGVGAYFLLSAQFRMHPEIRAFPSAQFYRGRIRDGYDGGAASRWKPFHACDPFGPVRFLDVVPTAAQPSAYENVAEARLVARLTAELLRVAMVAPAAPGSSDRARLDLRRRIGVISPYRKQLAVLRQALEVELDGSAGTDRAAKWVTVSTVDGFQGQEKDVIILSCVRTRRAQAQGGRGGIGFLRDARRLNVALTRARHSVIIVGDAAWLHAHDATWRDLIDNAARRNLMRRVSDMPSLPEPPAGTPTWSSDVVWLSIGKRMAGFV